MEFQTEHHHQNKYLSLFVLRNTWQLILSKVTVFQLLFLRNEFLCMYNFIDFVFILGTATYICCCFRQYISISLIECKCLISSTLFAQDKM